jgi:hypothetical protein
MLAAVAGEVAVVAQERSRLNRPPDSGIHPSRSERQWGLLAGRHGR